MLRTSFCTTLLVLTAVVAYAQSETPRFYAAGTTAVDMGGRGNISGSAVPSAGTLFGVRVTDAWSIEVEVERGFWTDHTGSGEAVFVSYPPGTNPSREEIERYGIRARFDRTQKAGAGWSALASWRTREAGRFNVGVLAGVSSRLYTSRVVRTPTFVSPLLNLPADDRNLQVDDSSRRMWGTGLTGGLVFLIRAAPSLTIAPEIRYTHGFITNDPYIVVKSGVRAMFAF